MNLRNILLSLFMAFSIFSLLQFLFGYKGVSELQNLVLFQHEAESNLSELKYIHNKLKDELKALQTAPDIIHRKARALGYFRKNEKIILIKGIHWSSEKYNPGSLVYMQEKNRHLDRIFRVIGLIAGTVTFFILWALSSMRKRMYDTEE